MPRGNTQYRSAGPGISKAALERERQDRGHCGRLTPLRLFRSQFPTDLPEHTQQDFRVHGRQHKAMDEATQSFFRGFSDIAMEMTTFQECLVEYFGDSLNRCLAGWRVCSCVPLL